jgi:ribosomal-protein-alanine N-acetyltransferase
MPAVRKFEVQQLLPSDAELISHWRYAGRYCFYDGPGSESAAYMLDPRNGFHAVRGPSGLVGFCSYGSDARVPGGIYDDDALDIGAGMDPTLVGRGSGKAFLGAIVEYATLEFGASRLRATIASWNERALRASRSVGFRPTSRFRSDKGIEFTIMIRETVGVAARR